MSFFLLKKTHIIYIGNKKTPLIAFFSPKTKLCWKTIKILKLFFPQKLTQFFTFFSTRHFRLKNIYKFQILLTEKTFYTENFKIFQVLFENTICIEKKEVFPRYTTIGIFYLKRGPSESFVLRTGNNFFYTNFHAELVSEMGDFFFLIKFPFCGRERERCSSQS